MDDITALLKEVNRISDGNVYEGDEEIERRSGEKRPQNVSHGKWEGRGRVR